MKVNAGMLWVMPPASVPQSSAENRFAVHRPAVLRRRRLANAFRFSREEPHPHDEEAETACHPSKNIDHGRLIGGLGLVGVEPTLVSPAAKFVMQGPSERSCRGQSGRRCSGPGSTKMCGVRCALSLTDRVCMSRSDHAARRHREASLGCHRLTRQAIINLSTSPPSVSRTQDAVAMIHGRWDPSSRTSGMWLAARQSTPNQILSLDDAPATPSQRRSAPARRLSEGICLLPWQRAHGMPSERSAATWWNPSGAGRSPRGSRASAT